MILGLMFIMIQLITWRAHSHFIEEMSIQYLFCEKFWRKETIVFETVCFSCYDDDIYSIEKEMDSLVPFLGPIRNAFLTSPSPFKRSTDSQTCVAQGMLTHDSQERTYWCVLRHLCYAWKSRFAIFFSVFPTFRCERTCPHSNGWFALEHWYERYKNRLVIAPIRIAAISNMCEQKSFLKRRGFLGESHGNYGPCA